jgi:hypothetical protein
VQVQALAEPAGDPVHLEDDHGLDVPGEEVAPEPVELGPRHLPAGLDVDVPLDLVPGDPAALQPAADLRALGIGLLVPARDADVGGDGPWPGDGLLRLRHGGILLPRQHRRPAVNCQVVYTADDVLDSHAG